MEYWKVSEMGIRELVSMFHGAVVDVSITGREI
jgi:hypothetical protein